ncbi:MGDG synthase family glycosyltransferase [Blastochloris viridis]|uniref:Monogalactosyldiacylglycerol synthase n=1 Tax=Blastochloris viridis TaxID=1079 RepID=A0A0H5BNN4_BLAVI|nr:glycosyltransferase [Blastochloris viridis]ALK08742.1 Processive diacylglycerol beta-glucosyltransferase [Blastochloris viridis]BAR97963.1 monogalactosyldiacylglycerol synthase [Blastochloris viridis]CUU41403.1 Processive diacylglycerol glucosyltransferase [Blastochloris viridis]
MSGSQSRVLILMSRTGGGHLASARALAAEFERQRPGTAVEIVDVLIDHLIYPINRLPGSYDLLVNHAPWLWKLLWQRTSWPQLTRLLSRAVRVMSRPRIRRMLTAAAPDLVVSVHPLVNALVAPVLADVAPATPFATVVTDLGSIHPTWFDGATTALFVPTERAAAAAVKAGRPRATIHACGLPVRATFAEAPSDRAEARAAFGMVPNLPAVLVMGGGDGIGPVGDIVRALAGALGQGRALGQVVVVCGRNSKLKNELAADTWPAPVTVLGFVDQMAELMHASDLLVTKAGPGTIAEATICGLPILFSGFIPGQEEGNVDYVVDHGGGLFVKDPAVIARTVVALFGAERARLAAMAAKSRALGHPRATEEIVGTLCGLLAPSS